MQFDARYSYTSTFVSHPRYVPTSVYLVSNSALLHKCKCLLFIVNLLIRMIFYMEMEYRRTKPIIRNCMIMFLEKISKIISILLGFVNLRENFMSGIIERGTVLYKCSNMTVRGQSG